jgi:cobalt-zinc-cadmium efflux system protein
MTIVVVAAIGIAVNLGAAWLVRDGHGHDLNRRGAYLHLVADAAVSLATVLAGAGMLWLGWRWLDPMTALLVGVVVAVGAFGLLRDSFNAAMDAVPAGIDQAEVRAFLAGQPGVCAVHHLHIWSLGAGEVALTAHLVRPEDDDPDAFIASLASALDARFGINHATLQVERSEGCTQADHGAGAASGARHRH